MNVVFIADKIVMGLNGLGLSYVAILLLETGDSIAFEYPWRLPQARQKPTHLLHVVASFNEA